MRLAFPALLIVGLSLTSNLNADDKKDLEGKWVVVSVERDGKPWAAMQGAVRVNTGDKYTFTPKEGKAVPGTSRIDPTRKPKTIDMTPTEGNFRTNSPGHLRTGRRHMKGCFAESGKNDRRIFQQGGWSVVHK